MNCMKKNLLEMVQVNVPDFFILMKSEKMKQLYSSRTLILTKFTNNTKNLHVFWPISSK